MSTNTTVKILGKIGYHDIYKPDRFSEGTDKPKFSVQLVITDEELAFGLDFSSNYKVSLNTFLESENTNLGQSYFMGYKTKKGIFMVVAEIDI